MSEKKLTVSVLGAGSWGTTLALILNDKGHHTTLWEFFPEAATTMQHDRENKKFLPGIIFPPELKVTSDLREAVPGRDILVMAVPSHIMRTLSQKLKEFNLKNALLVSIAKGIENDSLKRMSEVITESILGLSLEQVVVLSGPSHAEEVSRKIPTAVVTACTNHDNAKKVQEAFMLPYLRLYSHDDVVGVEVGGSVKNVIAIAAGICDGANFGDNTKAALLTRGLVEISRLGVKMGANLKTFSGLTGMGDLIVTCMSRHSRNRYVGEEIGKGRKLKDILNGMVMVAEGVKTSQSVYDLMKKYHVSMPISEEVYRVLFEEKDPHRAVNDLMTREAKMED